MGGARFADILTAIVFVALATTIVAHPGTAGTEAADAEHLPAAQAVTEPGTGSEDSEHTGLTDPGGRAMNNKCWTPRL